MKDNADQIAPVEIPKQTLPSRLSAAESLERIAGIILSNRFLWLCAGAGTYLILQLSYVQWHSASALGKERFDTLVLASFLMLIYEISLVISTLICIGGMRRHHQVWLLRWPDRQFSYALHALATMLCVFLMQILLLVPILALHAYPQLAAAGYNLPLMFMQRAVLMGLVIQLFSSFIFVAHFVIRIRLRYSMILVLGLYLITGYLITLLSYYNDALARLNDLYFYNQLWKYVSFIPNLQRDEIYTNMQTAGIPYFGYYALVAALAWLFSILLWLPASMIRTEREAKQTAQI